MLKKFLRRIFILRNVNEEIKVVSLFRYISLILTSLFYLIGDHHTPMLSKLIVVVCMSIASYVLNYLYVSNYATKHMIKLIIFMEIIGNTMVLVPTGGMNSPYFLYSINTILIIVYYFNVFYSFINIFLYIVLSLGVSSLLLNIHYNGVINALVSNSNVILNYLLISVVSQQLLMLSKKLTAQSSKATEANRQLLEANKIINNSMEYIISLYQTVYSLKNISNKDNLIKLLVQYTKKITNTSTSFYFMYTDYGEKKMEISGDFEAIIKDNLSSNLDEKWENIYNIDTPITLNVSNREFLLMIIKSSKGVYGALGIEINNKQNSILYMESINQMKFLSSLSVLTFERLELEEINERLLIGEEQKRIADEIHDITSQRLFGASCMINTLIYKSKDMEEEQLTNELKLVRDILGKSITELRNTIYNLSRNNTDISVFKSELLNFTKEISRLNNIKISFNLTGNQDLLNSSEKKIIFRIICESTGNAVRHGKCNNIFINLTILKDHIKLLIKDDGIGFDVKNTISKEGMGLGIKNMTNSIYLMNGEINIDSHPEKGTSVEILLPNKMKLGTVH